MSLAGPSVILLEDFVFVVLSNAQEGDALPVLFVLFFDLVEDEHYVVDFAHGQFHGLVLLSNEGEALLYAGGRLSV